MLIYELEHEKQGEKSNGHLTGIMTRTAIPVPSQAVTMR